MVAPDHDRCFDLSFPHQLVHRQPELRPLAITQPADARRQALKLDSLASQVNPSTQNAILREKLKHQIIGDSNVRRLARKSRPSERAPPLAEQWPDIRRDKSRKVVCVLHTT